MYLWSNVLNFYNLKTYFLLFMVIQPPNDLSIWTDNS